jgi:hypothetical protein
MTGARLTSVKVNPNAQFGWSLSGGGAIDDHGNVYFSWEGYEQNGQAKGPVNIYVTKSTDGGLTWTQTLLDVSGSLRTVQRSRAAGHFLDQVRQWRRTALGSFTFCGMRVPSTKDRSGCGFRPVTTISLPGMSGSRASGGSLANA